MSSLFSRGFVRSTAVKRILPLSARSFGAFHVPVGPRAPDNVYRRPLHPVPSEPLNEADPENIYRDSESPEPLLDHMNLPYITATQALGQWALAVITIFGSIYALVGIFKPHQDPDFYAVPREYPFDNLRLSFGGAPLKKPDSE